MNVITIEAQPRVLGKGGANAARRSGFVPCVLYGHGADNVHFQVDSLSMHRLVFTTELHRLDLKLDGESFDCILKDVAFDPVRNAPIHADFQLLVAGEKIEISVPVQFNGTPKGKLDGGDVQFLQHELTVLCLPANIPESLPVEITHLEIGDTIHVSDLSFENMELVSPPQQSVVAVTAKRVEEEPVEEEAILEGEPGEEGEATEGETETEAAPE